MNQTTHGNKASPLLTTFFPRVIREFDDHDEPLIYGGK